MDKDIVVREAGFESIKANIVDAPKSGVINIVNIDGTLKQVDSDGTATSLGSGGGSSTITTTTIAELALIESGADTGRELGDLAWVQSVGDFFGLRTSAVTVDNITAINALGRSGCQWVRLGVQNRTWAARTTWLVDPQNVSASDENTGLSGSPLSTLSEVSRRLANAIIPTGQLITITLVSDCLGTDRPVWTHVHQPGANSGDGTVIVGTPTVVYTGTVTGWVRQTQGNVAAADDNQLTDSAIPVSYTASGLIGALLWQRTNGTSLWWHGTKDLGSKTVRITDPATSTGTLTNLTVGDTYTVSSLPKIYDQSFAPRSVSRVSTRFQIQFCDSRATTTSATGPQETAEITWDRCTFSTATVFVNASLLNTGAWALCTQIGPGYVLMRGGLFAGGPIYLAINGARIAMSTSGPTHFQGVALSATQGGSVNGTLIAFYDCTSSCISSTYGSVVGFTNLKGKGNTSKLLTAGSASSIVYNHAAAPPCTDLSTSDPAPIKAGNTSIATAGLPHVSEISTYLSAIIPTP